MSAQRKFSPEAQAQIVEAIRGGATTAEACRNVPISVSAFKAWLRRPEPEFREFRGRVELARVAAAGDSVPHELLSREELLAKLDRQARNGSIRAIQLLLERPWEKKSNGSDGDRKSSADPMDDLERSDELARRRSRPQAA